MFARKFLLLILLIAFSALSLTLSFGLRFDFALPPSEWNNLLAGIAIFTTTKPAVLYASGEHRRLWELAGFMDMVHVLASCAAASLLACALTALARGLSFPRSIYLVDAMVFFILTAGLLFSRRMYRELRYSRPTQTRPPKAVLIYGAGHAGSLLVNEIRSNRNLNTRAVGFLDDDPQKLGAYLSGVWVLGRGSDAAKVVARQARSGAAITEIVIAIPSASREQMRNAVANCRAANVPFRTVPSMAELLEGKVLHGQIREVSVNDLLGREPVRVAEDAISEHIAGKSVIVTGGCGSIGSELCRQLARFRPRRLVIFDHAESEMFMLALELRERFPQLDLVTEIGDISRFNRICGVMSCHQIEAVFHAAAYKHVPLMESHIAEAAENNVLGTWNVARAAQANGVKNFLMISSDKAVNPTSVMGLTKRIGEIIVSAMPPGDEGGGGAYVSVRFGNVLASNGSVVNIFHRQIAAGGPVTVTHPDMRRYFMSIPEAVQLVLQAFSMGKGGEIFVLDMGEPVLISSLAQNMIRLAGFTPGKDIQIRHSGLRPGEKLFEELRTDAEDMLPTYHEKIKIFRSAPLPAARVAAWLEQFQKIVGTGDPCEIKAYMAELVPEYLGQPARVPNGPVDGASIRTAHA